MTGKIIWLASYPKSGNTWFRVFLANLLGEECNDVEGADINTLHGGPIASSRKLFDNHVGVEASDLLPDEINELRQSVYERTSNEAQKILFMKVHDAFTYLHDGTPLFSAKATKGVIYIIRNPLDITLSFANHLAREVERIIPKMANEEYSFCSNSKEINNQLRQRLLSWSNHVQSWANAPEVKVHVVRYEDMKLNPFDTFYNAVKFACFSCTREEVHQAVELSSFDRLKRQEEEKYFNEKPIHAGSFFRKGAIGTWRETLTEEQVKTIIYGHEKIMKRFGYLTNDGKIVF